MCRCLVFIGLFFFCCKFLVILVMCVVVVVFGIMVKKKWCMGIGGGVLNLGSVS